MKKMLSILTALALGSTGAASVVACGTNEVEPSSWGLDEYQGKDLKIWIEATAIDKLDADKLVELLWTGIFDADDKDGDHSRQMKRFNDQEVASHLKIANSDEIITAIKAGEATISTVEISLDKDLESRTDAENPTKYILKQSEATLTNITVNTVKSELVIDKTKVEENVKYTEEVETQLAIITEIYKQLSNEYKMDITLENAKEYGLFFNIETVDVTTNEDKTEWSYDVKIETQGQDGDDEIISDFFTGTWEETLTIKLAEAK